MPNFANSKDLLLYAHQKLFKKSLVSVMHQVFPHKDLDQWTIWQKNKGLIGQSIDAHLGVISKGATVDFPHLNVEVKSLPLTQNFLPAESTFITMAPLRFKDSDVWKNSPVYLKIQTILWVPFIRPTPKTFKETTFLSPFLWSPGTLILKLLEKDWEELKYEIIMGKSSQISSRIGQYIQLRSKGRNKCSKTLGYNRFGKFQKFQSKAYYFRRAATLHFLHEPLNHCKQENFF